MIRTDTSQVQADVMMITTRRNERCLRTEPMSQFEAQYPAVKIKRPVEIRHFQVNVANPHLRINRNSF